MVNVTSIYNSFVNKLKREGPLTVEIFSIEDKLKKLNWNTNIYDYNLQDLRAIVDYDNKILNINISSAYYAAQLFKRIEVSINSNCVGKYLYLFEDGEKCSHDGNTENYHHLYLTVTKI